MDGLERTRGVFRVTLETALGQHILTAAGDQHLWDAAQMAGIILPAICHQGRCLTCAAHLEAPGEFDATDAELYFPQDREAGFILLCTAKARSDLHLKTHQESQMRVHRLSCGLPAPYA